MLATRLRVQLLVLLHLVLFVQISPAVEALVHISELGEGGDPEKIFKQNEKRKFVILEIDADSRKIRLGFKK